MRAALPGEQDGRLRLVVEQDELLEATVALPSELVRVRPEEVVEVAEGVGMDGGPAAAESGDYLPVPELDDAHAPSVENRRMRAVVQRVSRAAVRIDGEIVGACGPGLLVLVGAGHEDTAETAERLAGKIARLRIFPDDAGRFDRSLLDTGGEALVVSQFTLLADSRRQKGTRPASRTRRDPRLPNR